jgi:cysteinyl-tRNA synthetase
MDEVLGLKLFEQGTMNIPKEIKALADKRQKAREGKDWAKSDELRDELKEKGWIVKDSKEGYLLEKD